MARKAAVPASKTPDQPAGPRRLIAFAATFAGLIGLAIGGVFVFATVEGYLIQDKRFAIPPPRDYGEESANIRVRGVVNASPEQVAQVFARDIGRSLYLFPVRERRRNLLAVDWVREASVQRLWPNSVMVEIEERKPVAFIPAQQTGAGMQRSALIDEDGEILYPHRKAAFRVPVLLGITPQQHIDVRRKRIHTVMRLLTELGPEAEKLSEIDVSNPESLEVTVEVRGASVTLILGNRGFLPRLRNFFEHYDKIRERSPDAPIFDLRLEDRITALGPEGPAEGEPAR